MFLIKLISLQLNPQHQVPVIVDNGYVLYESRAIIQYLANRYGNNTPLYPQDAQQRGRVDWALNFDLGTLAYHLDRYYGDFLRYGKPLDRDQEQRVREAFNFLDQYYLAKHRYIAGDFLSIADLSILATLTLAEGFDYNFSQHKNVATYRDRLRQELKYYDEINKEAVETFRNYVKAKTQKS